MEKGLTEGSLGMDPFVLGGAWRVLYQMGRTAIKLTDLLLLDLPSFKKQKITEPL